MQGLATLYLYDRGTLALLRMLFCLPFLPAEHIEASVQALEDLNTADNLQPVFHYINRTWINSSLWLVDAWSVYGQSVHTNDVEGGHRRLNIHARAGPPFYTLLTLLNNKAKDVSAHDSWSVRWHCAAWNSCRTRGLSATGLLKKVSCMYRPALLRVAPDEVAVDS